MNWEQARTLKIVLSKMRIGWWLWANKFQEGFDEPLLAGMFLDKPVFDRKAVQTVRGLIGAAKVKTRFVVVDFTNNAKEIVKAF